MQLGELPPSRSARAIALCLLVAVSSPAGAVPPSADPESVIAESFYPYRGAAASVNPGVVVGDVIDGENLERFQQQLDPVTFDLLKAGRHPAILIVATESFDASGEHMRLKPLFCSTRDPGSGEIKRTVAPAGLSGRVRPAAGSKDLSSIGSGRPDRFTGSTERPARIGRQG